MINKKKKVKSKENTNVKITETLVITKKYKVKSDFKSDINEVKRDCKIGDEIELTEAEFYILSNKLEE